MKELKQLFEGVAGIPDDFADKVETVFEAAVKEKAEALANAAISEAADKYADSLKVLEESLAEKSDAYISEALDEVDAYLTEAVAEWMQENAVALDSELKGAVAVQYMKGLKSLVSESSALLGSDSAIVESYKQVVSKLESKNKHLMSELEEATEAVVALSKKIAFSEATEKLALTTKDRVAKLAESIDTADIKSYKTKLDYIIEAVSDKRSTQVLEASQDEVDDIDDKEAEGDKSQDDLTESQEKVLAAYRAAQAYL